MTSTKALIEEDLLSDINGFIVRHEWAGLALIKYRIRMVQDDNKTRKVSSRH